MPEYAVPDAAPAEDFQGLVLRFRGRSGLTQRQLAYRTGASPRSVQAWEAGISHPSTGSLQALITCFMEAGGFARGREAAEAEAMWAAALHESPRHRAPFDTDWFADLLARQPPAAMAANRASAPAIAAPTRGMGERGTRLMDWGDAPDVLGFLGRTEELQVLTQWVLHEPCRLVALLGIGGIGKTTLAVRLARDVAPAFARVYWRSVRNAPPMHDWLGGAIAFLSDHELLPPDGEMARLKVLLQLLRDQPCLLVLDNLEPLLQAGGHGGAYLEGFSGYGTLLRMLAEGEHQSCLLFTSREAPSELAELAGGRALRTLELGGLSVTEVQALLSDRHLRGGEPEWASLVTRYGGNGLALKVVAETVVQVFGGDIAAFLEQAGFGTFGGIRRLLDGQVDRLSLLEQQILAWLGLEREPATFGQLVADLGSRSGRGELLEAVEALRRRSLIDRAQRGAAFTLQSVVLEYVTDRLLERATDEIEQGQFALLKAHALLKAQAKDYVRRTQERLLMAPLLERLVASYGTRDAVEQRCIALLDQLRQLPQGEQRYGPGNLVNLLRVSRGDLNGLDLSGLSIRQAFLQDIEAHDTSLAGARLDQAVLAEAFNYPSSVALDADGTLLAAGTSTGEICLWRVTDRALIAVLRGHTGLITSLALSADAGLLASGSVDGSVRLWEVGSARLLATFVGHSSGVRGVVLSRDGRLVAGGSVDGSLKLWEVGSGRLVETFDVSNGGIWSLALSGDAQLIAAGSEDGTVRMWEIAGGRLVSTLAGHAGAVWSLVLSSTGALLASGSLDGTVRLWDTASNELRHILKGHSAAIWSVALSDDGRLVASGSEDATIRLWETANGNAVAALQGHTGGVRAVALTGDGHLLASGSYDGTACLWDAAEGRPLATFQGHADGVWAVALSGDGQVVISGGEDRAVRVWDAASGRMLTTFPGHAGPVRGVSVSDDGTLVASGSADATVRLWDTSSRRLLATLQQHTAGIHSVALTPDGRLLASASEDGTVIVSETASGRVMARLLGHAGQVYDVALSADGDLLASSSFDGTVRLWHVASSTLQAILRGHTAAPMGVALSDDGGVVASGGYDSSVRLWDATARKLLRSLEGHTGGVRGVALARDGRTLASGGFDRIVRLWETNSGRLLRTMTGHTGGVWSVALSRSGDLLASGGADGTVRLWQASTGRCMRTLRGDRRYERLDITGLTGVTEAQRQALLALGAVERSS